MTDHYIRHNAEKKNFLRKGLTVMVTIAMISTVFMTRYALSGSRRDAVGNAPDYDDAYLMAQNFIRPTINSSDITFPQSGYQCAQKPDSVFIVKSYAEKKGKQAPQNITSFEITIKFTGGPVADKKNWKVIDLVED